jgi:hypothetical protein
VSVLESLGEACRAAAHPVGVLARDGSLIASSKQFRPPLFPLPPRGISPEGDRDLLVIPMGEVSLVVELPPSPAGDVEEAALLVRRLAQVQRRTQEELTEALSRQDVVRLLAEMERLLADPGEAPLAEVARLFSAQLAGRQVHLRCALPGGVAFASSRGQPLEGALVFRQRPAPGVEAVVLVEGGPLEPARAELLELLSERLAASAMRAALREQQAAAQAAAELASLAATLAHEANSPLAALLADLEHARQEAASPDAADALGNAREAARRLAGLVRQLQHLARAPSGARQVTLSTALAAFDRRRGAETAVAPGFGAELGVLGEAGPVLAGLEALGAAVGARRATAGPGTEGFELRVDGPAPEIPEPLALRGVRLLDAGPPARMLVPFRLVPPAR